MMSVGVRRSVSVSVSMMSSVITIAWLSSGGWLSLSLSISISGPLAVVVSSIAPIIPSTVVASVSVAPAVVPVSRLGSNNSEEDDGESNQKFHVVRSSFST